MAAERVKKKAVVKKKAAAKATKPPPPAVVKKPKKPAKANKPLAVPHQRTMFVKEVKAPPKPKATISRAKALALANTFLKENVGKAALYAPCAMRHARRGSGLAASSTETGSSTSSSATRPTTATRRSRASARSVWRRSSPRTLS